MFKVITARLRQGHRTMRFPAGSPPPMSDRFRGKPIFDTDKCPTGCRVCAEACPTEAITIQDGNMSVDLGKCLFCLDCSDACPQGAISHSTDYRMAVRERKALVLDKKKLELELAETLDRKMKSLFGRSLRLRQVSAGGCNACEADVNVLNTIGWDLGRFGIQFVASPRHADGLLVTGPITKNMELALKKTYDAVSEPKIVIAVGACAISGGPYARHPETNDGIGTLLPVDLYIPGCPPHPLTILDGLLRLIGKIQKDGSRHPTRNRSAERHGDD